MKHLLTLAFILITVLPIFSQEEKSDTNTEITTYYFIRHAEKDRSDASNRNPHLTDIGNKRATHWSDVLQHVTFDAIYSTDYHRTKETAKPTALKNEKKIIIYSPKNIDVKTFMNETKGKTILIVGHSNTTPAFVNKILGETKYADIDDSNNGNLYIVTIQGNKIMDQLLVINQQ